MAACTDASSGFWLACVGPEDFLMPLSVDAGRHGRALAVFSYEEEAMLYLRLRDPDGGFRPVWVPAAGLLRSLCGRWSGYESVALDPMPETDACILLPLTTTSRERFVHFLASRRGWTFAAV